MFSIPHHHVYWYCLQKGFRATNTEAQSENIRKPSSCTHTTDEKPKQNDGRPKLEIRTDFAYEQVGRKDAGQVSSNFHLS